MNINSFIKPLRTIPLHKKLKAGGQSKNKEWGAIEGVPCQVKCISDKCIHVESFTSSPASVYIIDTEQLKHFEICDVVGGNIMGLDKYPGGSVDVKEFTDGREAVCNFIKKIKTICDDLPDSDIIKIILNDKLGQMWATQGAPCMTIPNIEAIDLIDVTKGIKRYDNMIFNRNSRWCPPITMSYEAYEKSNSFSYPIGIRPKDFCLPYELISTCTEMIKQIACFDNINPETKQKLLSLIDVDIDMCEECHKCKWCGEVIDANDYSSTYSSKDNFIEICHADPNTSFIPSNMYWGHGECNRQQGGYSEIERVKQFSRLIKAQPHLKKFLTHHE